jgi:hypothetical protein
VKKNLKSKISCQTPFKYRSETNSVRLQLVKIEAKMNLVWSLIRSKTKRTACPWTSEDRSENVQVVPKFWRNEVKWRELSQHFQSWR